MNNWFLSVLLTLASVCFTGGFFFSRCICKTFFFKDCDKGMYGHECNETCGHCDDVDRCSPINGTCLNGCDAGYLGDFCNASEFNIYFFTRHI